MPSTGAPATRHRLLWLLAMILACSGCQLGLDIDVALNRDGGGTLGVGVSADAELLARAEQAGVDPLAELADTAAELRDAGWSVDDTTDGSGTRTVRIASAFADAAEFNELSGQLADALAADEVVLLSELELEVAEETLVLRGAAGAEPTKAVRDYGLRPARVVRLVEREQALAYQVNVTVPADVVSTNGDDGGDGVVTWTVPVGESVDLALEATRPGFPILRAVLGALVGGLVAGAALWFVLRRRQPASARSARMRSFSART